MGINVLQNKNGFTLIETIVALFIFSIGMLGLISSYFYIYKVVTMTKFRNTAIEIAQKEIEKLRTEDFDTLSSACPGECNPDSNNNECFLYRKISNNNVKFGKSISILPSNEIDLKIVRVTICYKVYNKIKSYTLNTIIRKVE